MKSYFCQDKYGQIAPVYSISAGLDYPGIGPEHAYLHDMGKAFIPFITCGDPDLETTAAAVRAAVNNGADLIELGIPFSDPTAEGPVIQGANLRALTGGITTDAIFSFVKELRQDIKVPMVFMTYANVVFSYDARQFISTCRDIEIDGLILPDLPFEEKEEFLPLCHQYGVDLIWPPSSSCWRNTVGMRRNILASMSNR